MLDPFTDRTTPFWTVYAIFDPDGGGGDFSYTVGLHERGLPELWIAARPSLGEDPGLDWKLSQADTCSLLNEVAWDWVAGRRRVGDVFEEAFDDGLVTARFQIDPADDPGQLEAFQIAPRATVVPIRWSLHRPPPGENAPLTAEERDRAVLRFGLLTYPLPEQLVAPSQTWALPEVPAFDPGERWGPRTAVVQALATYFWTCRAHELLDLIRRMIGIDEVRRWTWPLAAVHTAARAAGREGALARLQDDIEELVDLYLAQVQGPALALLGRDDQHEVAFLRASCVQILQVGLGAELVADFLSEDVRLHALGLLVANRMPRGVPAGPEWYAEPAIVAAVDQILVEAGPERIFRVCQIHAAEESPEYLRAVDRLEALTNSTAASWTPADDGVDEDFVRGVERASETARWCGDLPLQEWACFVAAVLTHRSRVTDEQLLAFVAPYRAVLPDLEVRLT